MTFDTRTSSHTRYFPRWAAGRARSFKEAFADAFEAIAVSSIERERTRTLPFAEMETLRDVGFTRVTLPPALGGGGADLVELFELLAHLAQHDPNLAQALRSHFAHIERQLLAPASGTRDRALRRVAEGAIYGNASHERSAAVVGSLTTRITKDDEGHRLDGVKYYSTGTVFADWVSVSAVDENGDFVGVAIDTSSSGVTRLDDWNGFGQRLTGSGTTTFDGVRVPEENLVRRSGGGRGHGGAFVQLVLLATLSGIGRAVVSDATDFVASRTRVYSHGSASTAAADPIIQETLGELSALSFQTDSALAAAVQKVQESHDRQVAVGDDIESAADWVSAAEEATAHAQLVVVGGVLEAATKLFDVGGASATDTARGFDRHWRNARTISSHNPHRNKARAIGDLLLNDVPLSNSWQTGESAE